MGKIKKLICFILLLPLVFVLYQPHVLAWFAASNFSPVASRQIQEHANITDVKNDMDEESSVDMENPEEEEDLPDGGDGEEAEENTEEAGSQEEEEEDDEIPDVTIESPIHIFTDDKHEDIDWAEDENTLLENEKIIDSYTDFVAALTDTTTTVLYLNTDINVTGAININPAKSSLAIYGYNPWAEEKTRHTLSEYNNGTIEQSISVQSNSGPKSILLSHIIVDGKNHFGTISIYNDVKDVTITYDNVEYTGPQLTYNRNGSAIYKDCTVKIGKNAGPTDPGELAETQYVEFHGRNEITQLEAQGNETIFMELGAQGIVIKQGAHVTVKNAGDSGFLYSTYSTSLLLEENSYFYFEATNRFWENKEFSSVTLQDGAKMTVLLTGTLPYALLRITNGTLTVGKDAELFLTYTGTAAFPVLTMNNSSATFNDPKHVVLYHRAVRPLAYTGSDSFLNMKAQQINYWSTAGDGSFSDYPQYLWTNGQNTTVSIDATVSPTNSGTITSIVTDYIQQEGGVLPPSTATLNLANARVLSLGRLPLSGEYILSENGYTVAGLTNPFASYYSDYINEEGKLVEIQPVTKAMADGSYQFAAEEIFPNQTKLMVYANDRYLFQKHTILNILGGLKFQIAPSNLFFQTVFLSGLPVLSYRYDENWQISVLDTRGEESPWRITVKMIQPLTPLAEGLPALHDALVLVDEQGQKFYLGVDEEVLIYRHHPAGRPIEVTTINWDKDKGILAYIMPGEVYAQMDYQGILMWTLENVP